MSAGALLPWFSLYAGLHPYPGTTGANGWILLGGGLASVVLGAAAAVVSGRAIPRLIGAIGLVALLFSLWLALGLANTYEALQANPLLVPRLGPGLLIVAAGALLLLLVPSFARPSGNDQSG